MKYIVATYNETEFYGYVVRMPRGTHEDDSESFVYVFTDDVTKATVFEDMNKLVATMEDMEYQYELQPVRQKVA